MLPFLALLLLLFISDWKERELICWSEEDIYTIFVDDRPSELLVLLGVLLKTLAERGDSGALRRRRLELLLKSRYH